MFRKALDTASAAAFVFLVVAVARPRRPSEAELLAQAGDLAARYMKTRVLDSRYLSGQIDAADYRRQVAELWPES